MWWIVRWWTTPRGGCPQLGLRPRTWSRPRWHPRRLLWPPIFEILDPPLQMTPISLVTDQPDQVLLWHWRLGHPSVQKLRSVVPITSSVFTLNCKSCELGKHHRATYHSRVNNRSSTAFELVQSDVWGPSHVPFIKSFRYFLFFVDDFSRMIGLYLLTERSKVSKVIEFFSNEIKNQFLLPLVYFILTMFWSMSKIICLPSIPKIELFIRYHVLIHLNKIELLNANIDIFWMSPESWWYIWVFSNTCDLMLC